MSCQINGAFQESWVNNQQAKRVTCCVLKTSCFCVKQSGATTKNLDSFQERAVVFFDSN